MNTRQVKYEEPQNEFTIVKIMQHLGDRYTQPGKMAISLPRFKFLERNEDENS